MVLAVGQASDLGLAAEMEIGVLGIADRPAAIAVLKIEDALALVCGDYDLRPSRVWLDHHEMRCADNPSHLRGFAAAARGLRPCRRRSEFLRPIVGFCQPEPVHLADHGIARHAADAAGDPASTEALRPKATQQCDGLISPRPTGLVGLVDLMRRWF